jgi:probable phosphoglycerate mutase
LNIKKIYIVRHGQTDFNLRGIVQGSGVNSSLNSFGKEQAQAFFNAYREVKFDKIYTSALNRTIESVEPFLNGITSHEILPGLNEISWGKKEGQPITPEEDAFYYEMLRNWQRGDTHLKRPGGESPEEVLRRMKPAADLIMSRAEERNVLVCMHGRAMRILLCHLLHYPLKSMDIFEHENACLYQLNHTGTMFHIARFNDVSHLKLVRSQLITA